MRGMKTIKDSVNFTFIRLVLTATIPLFLCSCVSTRVSVAERHGLSEKMLPFVVGKWRNAPKEHYGEMLWTRLTPREKSPMHAVVTLERSDKQTLTATLQTNGVNMASRTLRVKQRASWLELPTQYIVHPLLWYVFWGLETREPAVGINRNGDLWVNSVGNGNLCITVLPTPIGGGNNTGTVDLYERVE